MTFVIRNTSVNRWNAELTVIQSFDKWDFSFLGVSKKSKFLKKIIFSEFEVNQIEMLPCIFTLNHGKEHNTC